MRESWVWAIGCVACDQSNQQLFVFSFVAASPVFAFLCDAAVPSSDLSECY